MGPVGANVSSLSRTVSADNSWPVSWAMCWIDGSKTGFRSSTVGRALALICVYRMPVRDDVDLLYTHKLLKLIFSSTWDMPLQTGGQRSRSSARKTHFMSKWCTNVHTGPRSSTAWFSVQLMTPACQSQCRNVQRKCSSSPAANTRHLANDCGCAARGLCVCACPRPLLPQEPWISLWALVYSALPRNTVGGRQSATFFYL